MDLSLLARQLKTEHPVPETLMPPKPDAAAVLIILYTRYRKPHVLLMQRSENLSLHAGQISFPGGIYEPEDKSLLATALRETREELDLDIKASQVLGRLPGVQTLTGYDIAPFIAIIDQLPLYRPNPGEVQKVLEIPLLPLLSTHHRERGYLPEKKMVAYWYLQYRIWGATAKILHHVGKIASIL